MWQLLARRLLQFPLVIAVIFVATFALVAAAPGDALSDADSKAMPEVAAQQRRYYGLDEPWHVRCRDYAADTAVALGEGRIDLGRSIFYRGTSVAEIIGLTGRTWSAGALRTSLTLGFLSLSIAVLAGVNLGLWAAARQNGLADHLTSAVAVLGVSQPTFVTGSILILLLGMMLPIFPVGGWGSIGQLILPAATLSLPFTAYIARLMRAGVLDVLGADYIRTARAKGLAEGKVVYRHAFKLAFLPVLSFLGPATASILTGSFVVERLFAIPGIGQHFVNSVLNRDQPLIVATVLVYAVLLVTFNLVVDVAYVFVDPRISREEAV